MGFDDIKPLDGNGPSLTVKWNNTLQLPQLQDNTVPTDNGAQEQKVIDRWGVNGPEGITVFNDDPENYAYLDPQEIRWKKLQVEFTGWGHSTRPIMDEEGQAVRGLAVEFFKSDSDGNFFRVLSGADTRVLVYNSEVQQWVVAQGYNDNGIQGEWNINMPTFKDNGEVQLVAVQRGGSGDQIYEVRLNEANPAEPKVHRDELKNMIPNTILEIRKRK